MNTFKNRLSDFRSAALALAGLQTIKATSEEVQHPLSPRLSGQPHPDHRNLSALKHKSVDLYNMLSSIRTSVRVVSGMVADTRLSVFERTGDGLEEIVNHEYEMLMERPNPLDTQYTIKEATASWLSITGDAYWFLNRLSENVPPSEVWVLPTNRMRPIDDGKMGLKGYGFDPGNGQQEIPLETWEVCHFKLWNPNDPFVGQSPMQQLWRQILTEENMVKYNQKYFDEGNVKAPGFLAFADSINNTDWETLQADFKRQMGGTERNTILLRGAGKAGVSWVSAGLSQDELQFLASRQFTKEEIYAMFAPGLAAMLAINANEANARAGDSTIRSLAVTPILSRIANRITNDILPIYSDNLVARFDDVRLKDRAIELREQVSAYAWTTINEGRQKYGGLPPLDDERGEQLIRPLGQSILLADGTTQGEDDSGDALRSATRMLTRPKGDVIIDIPDEELVRQELRQWRRKAMKAAKKGQGTTFEPHHIPTDLYDHVVSRLKQAKNSDDVQAVFDNPDEEGTLDWRFDSEMAGLSVDDNDEVVNEASIEELVALFPDLISADMVNAEIGRDDEDVLE